MHVILDTAQMAAKSREQAVKEAMAGVSVPVEVTYLGKPDAVQTRMKYALLDSGVEALEYVTSSMRLSRRRSHLQVAAPERLLLGINGAAAAKLEQHGTTRSLGVGELVMVDLTCGYEYEFSPGRNRSIQIDYSNLGLSVDQIRAAAFQLTMSPVYGLLRDHIWQMCEDSEQLVQDPAASAVTRATEHLIRALVRSATEPDSELCREALRESLLERILYYARGNIADPELGSTKIAFVHDISRPELARTWAPMGTGLEDWIAAERRRVLDTS
jgi:hypothetical protein